MPMHMIINPLTSKMIDTTILTVIAVFVKQDIRVLCDSYKVGSEFVDTFVKETSVLSGCNDTGISTVRSITF
jgi:hypothetical protein